MKRTTSRRTILAGIAASPALTAPALAGISSQSGLIDDPIFAAIEKHKTVFLLSLEPRRLESNTPYHDPVETIIRRAASAAHDAADEAANALTTIRPTTHAGVLALLQHVEQFNAGAFVLDNDWHSAPMEWPEVVEDDTDFFGFFILANVRAALEALAVQS